MWRRVVTRSLRYDVCLNTYRPVLYMCSFFSQVRFSSSSVIPGDIIHNKSTDTSRHMHNNIHKGQEDFNETDIENTQELLAEVSNLYVDASDFERVADDLISAVQDEIIVTLNSKEYTNSLKQQLEIMKAISKTTRSILNLNCIDKAFDFLIEALNRKWPISILAVQQVFHRAVEQQTDYSTKMKDILRRVTSLDIAIIDSTADKLSDLDNLILFELARHGKTRQIKLHEKVKSVDSIHAKLAGFGISGNWAAFQQILDQWVSFNHTINEIKNNINLDPSFVPNETTIRTILRTLQYRPIIKNEFIQKLYNVIKYWKIDLSQDVICAFLEQTARGTGDLTLMEDILGRFEYNQRNEQVQKQQHPQKQHDDEEKKNDRIEWYHAILRGILYSKKMKGKKKKNGDYFLELMKKREIKYTDLTLSLMMAISLKDATDKPNNKKGMAQFAMLLNKMVLLKVTFDSLMYNSVTAALASNGHVELTWQLFQAVREDKKVHISNATYDSMLQLFSRSKTTKTEFMSLLQHMIKFNVHFTTKGLFSVFHGLLPVGEAEKFLVMFACNNTVHEDFFIDVLDELVRTNNLDLTINLWKARQSVKATQKLYLHMANIFLLQGDISQTKHVMLDLSLEVAQKNIKLNDKFFYVVSKLFPCLLDDVDSPLKTIKSRAKCVHLTDNQLANLFEYIITLPEDNSELVCHTMVCKEFH